MIECFDGPHERAPRVMQPSENMGVNHAPDGRRLGYYFGHCIKCTTTIEHLRAELARCDREIAELEARHDEPAMYVAMGIEDWRVERALIEEEINLLPPESLAPQSSTGWRVAPLQFGTLSRRESR